MSELTNIHIATFAGNRVAACSQPFFQYDYGQILQFSGIDLPAAYEVHFSNTLDGVAETAIGGDEGVEIPDHYLQNAGILYAWVYLHAGMDDGETRYVVTMVVRARAAIENATPTPEQHDAIADAIAALNAAVEQTTQDVIDSGAAKEASETAQGKAEAAQEAAEGAQGAAEAAQRAAEDASSLSQRYAGEAAESARQAALSESAASADARAVADDKAIVKMYVDDAEEALTQAQRIEGNAALSAENAEASAEKAADYARTSKQNRDYTAGAVENVSASVQQVAGYTQRAENAAGSAARSAENAYRSVTAAAEKVTEAQQKATIAENAAEDARGWANGTDKNGNPVSSDDPHYHNNAYYFMLLCLAATGHYPKIENGYWYIWDVQNEQWSSTGVKATGADGEDGADGYSPTVTITSITGGHRITVTDADGDHSFDVMDGQTPTVPVQDVQVNGTSILSNGVANVPVAGIGSFGVITVNEYTSATGIQRDTNGYLKLAKAGSFGIKSGTNTYMPIVPSSQHESTFYGLAKLAGVDMSSSSNPVGTYTDAAKSAISQMLNAPVTVSGSTPSITALAGLQYICGECATLDITLPASGIVDVIFESGSTATVLTITPPTGVTVKWAGGFDPTSLDANTTYEINIRDGLGVAAAWT